MKRNRLAGICTAALIVGIFSEGAFAQYTGLNDTVVAEFSKEDHARFSEALSKALRSSEAEAVVLWSNPDTSAHGTVTASTTSDHDGKRCRRAKLESHANKKSGTSTFTFCDVGSDEWKVLR